MTRVVAKMTNGNRFGALRNGIRTLASDKTPLWVTLLVALLPFFMGIYQFEKNRNDAVLSVLVERAGSTASELLPVLNTFNNSIMDQYEFGDNEKVKGRAELIKNLTTQYSVLGDIVPLLHRDEQMIIRGYMSSLVEFKVQIENAQNFDDLKGIFGGFLELSIKRDKVFAILFSTVGGKNRPDAKKA